MICRRCDARWTFSEEMSPFLLRRCHTCARCGWVSERPARVFAVYCAVLGCLLATNDPWALRAAVALLGVSCIQLVRHGGMTQLSTRSER